MIRTTYTSHGSLYGPKEYPAYQTVTTSAFAVYRGLKIWTLGHPKTGLSLDSLIPATLRRTRDSLLGLVGYLEATHPAECVILAAMEGGSAKPEERDAALTLRRTALAY